MKKAMILLPLCAALLGAAEGEYELMPTVSYVKPDSKTYLKKYISGGVRLGQSVDEFDWISQIEIGADMAKAKYKKMGETTDDKKVMVSRYYIDGLKEFEFNRHFSLYALLGFGWEDVQKQERYDNNGDSGFATYGLGARVSFNCDWSVRIEARDSVKFRYKTGAHNIFATAGIAYKFGEKPECKGKLASPFDARYQ